jgi:hypothetical protein
MELPKSVRVGYRDFIVENWESRFAVASGRVGECDKMGGVIRVDTQYGPQRAALTLLHEVIHAIWDTAEMDELDLSEEVVVSVLAAQLTQIWRDNPDFVAFMSASLA